MNICLLSTSDGRGGGFTAVYRLHRHLKRAGHNSKILVAHKKSSDPDVIQINGLYYFLNRVISKLTKWILSSGTRAEYYYETNSLVVASARHLASRIPFKADLIVANWIDNFLSSRHLSRLNSITGSPIAWYLMDMAPLTGGCHYAWDCLGYTNRCGACPALGSDRERDASWRNLTDKARQVASADITVVPSTTWLSRQAAQATVFAGKQFKQIMLGVDPDVFMPVASSIARERLDLPQDKKIIFLGSTSITERRKGLAYFLEALHLLKTMPGCTDGFLESIFLSIAGRLNRDEALDFPFPTKYLGFLGNDNDLAAAYQAADVYVCPSIQDGGPMMINESMFCGTPVVSFDMGVAPDLVQSGVTGYRAQLANARDLAVGLYQVLMLSREDHMTMRQKCRRLATTLCHPDVQVKAFEELVSSLQAGSRPAAGTNRTVSAQDGTR